MSATLVPGTLVQISWTTELPVSNTRISTADAPVPMRLLAVRVTSKLPATDGMPLITPLVLLKTSPGGRPLAVNACGVFAAVTVKLNGWPRKATAFNELVITTGALDGP